MRTSCLLLVVYGWPKVNVPTSITERGPPVLAVTPTNTHHKSPTKALLTRIPLTVSSAHCLGRLDDDDDLSASAARQGPQKQSRISISTSTSTSGDEDEERYWLLPQQHQQQHNNKSNNNVETSSISFAPATTTATSYSYDRSHLSQPALSMTAPALTTILIHITIGSILPCLLSCIHYKEYPWDCRLVFHSCCKTR
jgi:hypothetical protein